MKDRKGARPVPGPTMMMGVDASAGSLRQQHEGWGWAGRWGPAGPACAPCPKQLPPARGCPLLAAARAARCCLVCCAARLKSGFLWM